MVILILCQYAQQQNNGKDNLTRKQYVWNLFTTNGPFLRKRITGNSDLVISDHPALTVSPWLPSEKLTIIIIIIFNNTLML